MVKVLSLKIMGWIIIGGILFAGGLIVSTATGLLNSSERADKNWRTYQEINSQQSTSLALIVKEMGYGGMIHQFKNYIIRKEPEYYNRVKSAAGGTVAALNNYQAAATTHQEREAIQIILQTVEFYSAKAEVVRQLIKDGWTSSEIDAWVRVDDDPALSGFKALQEEMGMQPVKGHVTKGDLLSQIYTNLGYGGLIHHFKNFVLRLDSDRIQKVQIAAEKVKTALRDYQSLGTNETEKRALEGIFLGFQYPVEIPGVSNVYLLKAALNARRKFLGEPEIDAVQFLRLVKEKAKLMKIDESFLNRGVNEGFSGGEKKRNEVFQMAVLEPTLVILDETDSGLDIDALKVVADGVNNFRNSERSFVLITHYQRLLDYIQPDYVHVLADGRIVKSGDKKLAMSLEERGYDWVVNPAQPAN